MNTEPPASPPHDRKLSLIGASLTRARLPRASIRALGTVRDELEKTIIDSGFLIGAPFSWVTLAIRYGLKADDRPEYGPVNKKYGDLPLSIEIPTGDMLSASEERLEELFRDAALRALIHAGDKYGRPTEALRSLLDG